ncbi:MAG: hypothetical protein ABIB04_02330 [Patescibacteria group bacterium]
MKTIAAYLLFLFSTIFYAGFWVWALIHAAQTPKSPKIQKFFWIGAIIVNPSTAIWYWYIWKRWAFWTLFTPILGLFLSLPFVVRSLITKADETNLTNFLFALGTARLVLIVSILIIFPLILKLAALLHLGRNKDLSAMDRNDWVVSLALPVFGFGAAVAYCAKYQRKWAILSLLWWLAIAFSFRFITPNITHALIPAGEEKREEFKAKFN